MGRLRKRAVSGLANGKSVDVWLGRAYDAFCKKPAEAEEVIARHVRGALATATDLPQCGRLLLHGPPISFLGQVLRRGKPTSACVGSSVSDCFAVFITRVAGAQALCSRRVDLDALAVANDVAWSEVVARTLEQTDRIC
jgi:hypothetical protein